MADKPSDAVDLQKVREVFEQERFKHHPIIAKLEESPDRAFVTEFKTEEGKPIGKVRFRKWTQSQVDFILTLPFYPKIAAKQELEPDEKLWFEAVKQDMVNGAILDKGRWQEFASDERFVNGMFYAIQRASGLDDDFAKRLDAFMGSELGYAYGAIWFGLMRKTPSEVGSLPPADYNAVMLWAQKWGERTK